MRFWLTRGNQFVLLSAGLLSAMPAQCSDGGSTNWSWPPLVVIPLALSALLYGVGMARIIRRGGAGRFDRWRIACFTLGWISLLAALDSPLHELGEQLFWVHMVQHEILVLIAAPLLVLSRPLVPFLSAFPLDWRRAIASAAHGPAVMRTWKAISAPLSAWLLSALALWIWHAPVLFDQTVKSDAMHAAQHASFFLTALLFWWPLANGLPKIGYGGGLAYVFTTALHTSVLGALLTFAPQAWYAPYQATSVNRYLSALEDQQLGGLIMWIPAGSLLLVVFLVLLVMWMRESQGRWQYTRMAELVRSSDGVIK
jgi:putative membrane protein